MGAAPGDSGVKPAAASIVPKVGEAPIEKAGEIEEQTATPSGDGRSLALWLTVLNLLIWARFVGSGYYSLGLGHDSQLYTPAVHAVLRRGNALWDPVLRLFEARLDLFSSPHFGVLYPFYWTLGWSSELSLKGQLILDTTSIAFHQIVASILFAWFLKRLGCRSSLAAMGGIAYAYSLHLRDWSGWIWAFSGYSWIPLCMIGAWAVVAEARYRAGMLFLAIGFGLITLASSLQLVYALALSGVVALAGLLHARPGWQRALRAGVAIGAGGVVGALLGATHVVPVMVRGSEYVRSFSGGAVVGGFKPPYEATLVATIDGWGPLHLLLPLWVPKGLGTAFVGAAVVALTIYLLVGHPKWRRFGWVLVAASAYFFMDAMGDLTPVHRLTYRLPLFGSVRYPVANVIVAVAGLLTTGFLGAEQMCRRLERGESLRRWGVGLAAGFTALGCALFFLDPRLAWSFTKGLGPGLLWLSLAAGVVVGLLLVLGTTRRVRALLPVFLLLGALPIQVALLPSKALKPRLSYLECDRYRELVEVLERWRGRTGNSARLAIWWTRSPEGRQCLGRLKVSSNLLENTAMAVGWNVRKPYMTPRPVYEAHLFPGDGKLRSQEEVLRAGITHLITNLEEDQIPAFYAPRHRGSHFGLYEVTGGRLWGEVAGCLVREGRATWLVDGDARRQIGLDPDAEKRLLDAVGCDRAPANADIARVERRRSASGSRVTYAVTLSQPSLLVTDRVVKLSWQIEVDGEPVSAVSVDGYRLGVPLPAGTHTIELRYRPWDFRLGGWLTLAGLVGLVGIARWRPGYSM